MDDEADVDDDADEERVVRAAHKFTEAIRNLVGDDDDGGIRLVADAGLDATGAWFPGATARTPAQRKFLSELRRFALDWRDLGLGPAQSIGIPTGLPFLGVEVPDHAGALGWLWIVFVEQKQRLRIECSWGDLERTNDWGPSEGDVEISVPASTGTPEELARYAEVWVRGQASREH